MDYSLPIRSSPWARQRQGARVYPFRELDQLNDRFELMGDDDNSANFVAHARMEKISASLTMDLLSSYSLMLGVLFITLVCLIISIATVTYILQRSIRQRSILCDLSMGINRQQLDEPDDKVSDSKLAHTARVYHAIRKSQQLLTLHQKTSDKPAHADHPKTEQTHKTNNGTQADNLTAQGDIEIHNPLFDSKSYSIASPPPYPVGSNATEQGQDQ